NFYDWAVPHIRVIRRPDGKYEVNYNAEHISKVSPLLKDYISDLSDEFEKELNTGKSAPLTAPPTIDIKVTQKLMMGEGLAGKLKETITGGKMRPEARYTMVLVGTSDTGNGKAPVQYFEYMPVNVQEFAAYKAVLANAACV